MIVDIFATKLGMTQAWTKQGKRLAITKVRMQDMPVLSVQHLSVLDKNSQVRAQKECSIIQVGFGKKKLSAMKKPLRAQMEKSGFSFGVKQLRGVRVVDEHSEPTTDDVIKAGDIIAATDILTVGDMVKVQGVTKGRGFAGAMKRHGFHGGPKTHGQSDRSRAVGSIGAGTTPGRVWPGKKMPGHHGVDTLTVTGLVVVHIDQASKEVWLSGVVPGAISSDIKITKTGKKKQIELTRMAVEQPAVTQESAE